MIIVSIISLFISFFFQGLMSNYLAYQFNDLSWFITIYPLVNLLILLPYFENDKKKIAFLIITGLLVDTIFTNTFIFNACLFVIAYFFAKMFHFFFPYNLFTINISNLFCMMIYHILSFLFLSLLRYDNYSFNILFKILSHSIIMTIIYSSILYLTIKFIYDKLELRDIK